MIDSMGELLVESNCQTYTLVSGRLAGVSACAGSAVDLSSASTIACGPGLGFTVVKVCEGMGPDHATPITFAPGWYLAAGAVPSAADAA